MYVRVKTNPTSKRKLVQIVHSVRTGDKVSQKIVRHVGTAFDEEELAALKNLALSIKENLEHEHQPPLFSPEELERMRRRRSQRPGEKSRDEKDADYNVNLKDIIEEERTVQGIHDVYGTLFDELGFEKIFKNPARQKASVRMFRDIVMARIANPLSKRASVSLLEEDFGVSLNLDLVYQMMDTIDEGTIEKLNNLTYRHTKGLFPEKIDVIFFDCTTLYFESFTEDEFKRNGYSKDLKFNQPQVLIALLVTKEGLPIGYRAFPGDTYEGPALIPILTDIRAQYDLDKVVFVADSGLFNKDNLTALEEMEENTIEYIVGCRIKNTPKKLQAQILDKRNYKKAGKDCLMGTFDYLGKTLLASWTEARSKKDAHDRKKAIERLQKKLAKKKNPKEYLSNYGYKKYLSVKGESTITLDNAQIEKDRLWDGLHGVITNTTNLSNKEVAAQYHNLWQIENAFRVAKHDLKVRPIFHWKPERVKAHLAISYTAYALVKYLEHRVRLQYTRLSPEQIRHCLIRVQTSILYDKEKRIRYALPSRISQEAKKIYQLCGISRSQTPYILKKL